MRWKMRYLKRWKEDAVSPVIATILMVAITVVLAAVLYLLVYLAGGYYMMVWAFLIDIIYGLTTPLTTEWINRHMKSDKRATVLSLSGMASCFSFTIFSPLMGLYVDAYSTQAAYLLLAITIGAFAVRQLAIGLYGRYAAKADKS